MRHSPAPALQNVLVARPSTPSPHPHPHPSTALVRRDDLLAAAALAAAADDAPRRSGVLAAVSRRFSRLSGSLRRRRHPPPPTPSSSSSSAAAAAAAAAPPLSRPHHPHNYHHPPNTPPLHKRLQAPPRPPSAPAPLPPRHSPAPARVVDERFEPAEHDHVHDLAVSSLRDPASRRLRQFGARDDDDTLLQLPRVNHVTVRTRPHSPALPPRVRHLPRVSALMPVRPPVRPVHSPVSSPASSSSRASPATEDDNDEEEEEEDDDDHNDDGRYRQDDGERSDDGDQNDYLDEEEAQRRKNLALCRLPTGMTNVDVERGIEAAIVEIASEGESDDDQGNIRGAGWADKGDAVLGHVAQPNPLAARSRSDAHHHSRPRQSQGLSASKPVFSRRVASPTHTARRMHSDAELLTNDKHAPGTGKDFSLFEDDYLSFQGFHAQEAGPKPAYQSMSSLLRSKRISSVTDSHSEDSDEAANVKAIGSSDLRWRMGRRTPLVPYVFRMKRGVALDDEE